MIRLHASVTVTDLDEAVRFYSALFGAEPSLRKDDYVKWMLDDPCLNLVVSTHGDAPGIHHLGIQLGGEKDVRAVTDRLLAQGRRVEEKRDAHCGYARSHKAWASDPENVLWEIFYTFEATPDYGGPT